MYISKIKFTRLRLDHGGNYTCVGTKRRQGRVQQSSVLNVKGKKKASDFLKVR